MQNEPEIIKILREEERLKNIQSKATTNNDHFQKSGVTLTTSSEDALLLFEADKGQCIDFQLAHLATIYRSVFDSSLLAILVLDTQRHIILWNAYSETLLGKTYSELHQLSVSELHPNNEWKKIESYLFKQHNFLTPIETKIFIKNNELLDVTVTLNVLKNPEGRNLGSLYIIQNISGQRQAEHRCNSLIEYAADSIYVIDRFYQYLMVNNTFLTQLGRTREEVLGKTVYDFYSSEETKEFIQKLTWVLDHGRPLKDIYSVNDHWFFRILNPIKDSSTSQSTAVFVISRDITENIKREAELKEKEIKYYTLFDFFPQMILLLDIQGKITEVNKQIIELLGYDPSEIIEKKLLKLPFLTKDSKKIIKKNFSMKKLNKTISPFEIHILTKSGEKKICMVTPSRLQNEQGEFLNDLIVISDITKRKQQEEAFRIKDRALTVTNTPMALINLEGDITYVNNSFLQLWGYTSEKDVIGKTIAHICDIHTTFNDVRNKLVSDWEWIGDVTGIRKDHSTFYAQLSASIITDELTKPTCIIGSFIHITCDMKQDKEISESEKRFQVILENSLDMIYQLNMQKKSCDYVSPSSEKIIGYSPNEMVSMTLINIEEMIHPEDRTQWNQHLNMLTSSEQKQNVIQSIEYRLKHKTHGYRWVKDTNTAIFDEHNKPLYIIGTVEDITDRKKVWDELVKSEEKYRILAETSVDGVFTTDSLGRLTYINPSFEKLLGRRKSQILATPFRKYLLEDSIYFFQQIFIDARKENEKIENVELEIVSGDGTIIPIEVNVAPFTKQEEFSGVVCTVRDITQRREIEDELKKNERLKTEFMNIAAHELRSPVTPIKGYLDLIIHDNETNEKIKNWAKISLRNAERLLKLVNDILDVARLDSDTMRFDMEKIDPVELINEIVEDMRPAIINKKLEFHINIPTFLPHIIGDKIRLSQVLKNLIGNSLKFTDCGYIGLEVEKKDNHLLITVIDTGIGISKDELKKIFTKFYQAYTGEDRNNEGTGLGLFISKEIIKKHQGTIWAESEVGKGSRFIIQLPYVYKMIVDFKA